MGSTVNKIEGVTNQAVGAVKLEVEKALGSLNLEVEGAAQKLNGHVRETIGAAKEAV
jgi:uncharacterized protein YjbJ (UPF0337 family)